ncbi:MAG: class I SAM-dependent methyltransferase [Chloroflexota bacterium]
MDLFGQPQVEAKEHHDMDAVRQTIQTYDKIASDYCTKTRQSQFLDWEEGYIKELLSFIIEPSPLVLDVGCGDGRHSRLIEKNGGKAIGIDLSRGMLEEAKHFYPHGDFREMDMRQLHFTDNFFDGIWASGSIYHVTKSDIKKVIKEFNRVIRRDGVVAVSFKLGHGEGSETDHKSYAGYPRYFAYYTVEEMRDLFDGFGFDQLESCNYPEAIYGDNNQQMWFRLNEK